MPALTKARLSNDAADHYDLPATIPNPQRVVAAAAEVRSAWTAAKRARRARLAKVLLLKALIAAIAQSAGPTRVHAQPPARELSTKRSKTRIFATASSIGVGTGVSSSTARANKSP
jgi:hypothetical protein